MDCANFFHIFHTEKTSLGLLPLGSPQNSPLRATGLFTSSDASLQSFRSEETF